MYKKDMKDKREKYSLEPYEKMYLMSDITVRSQK